jgi:transglutaminase-like putative cysteine protease
MLALWFLLALAGPGGALLELPEHPGVSIGALPDWVEPVEVDRVLLDETGRERPAADFDVLVSELQLLATAEPGKQTRFTRTAVRLRTPRGVDLWSSLTVEFDPTFETVSVHELRVFRDGWQPRSSSRTLLQQPEPDYAEQVLDQRLSLVIVVDDLRPGDVLAFAYSVRGRNPALEGEFSAVASLARPEPVDHLRVRVRAERELGVRRRLHGGAPEPQGRRATARWAEWQWDLEDTAGSPRENDLPADWWPQPWVQFSSYQDWNEVARWGAVLYETGPLPEELGAKVAEWNAQPLAQRVIAARDWVQQEIRYTAVLLDHHSLVPHETGDTLERRYGDCKAKTLLLVDLLRAMNVPAWPVLVNTGLLGGVAEMLPSPLAFDHVIVAAEVEGSEVWIDPTLRLQGGAALDQIVVPDYGVGLPLRADEDGLERPPNARIEAGGHSVSASYQLGERLDAFEVEVKTLHRGWSAESLRRQLESTERTDLEASYRDFYADGRKIESRDPLDVQDDRAKNEIVTIERYRVTGHPEQDPDRGFETLRSEIEDALPAPPIHVPGEPPRRAPLALQPRWRLEEEVILRTPARWTLAPVDQTIENPWFRFSVGSDAQVGQIRLRYVLETLADRVPTGDFDRYRADLDALRESLGYSIVFPTGRVSGAAWALAAAVLLSSALAASTLRWLTRTGLWREGGRP